MKLIVERDALAEALKVATRLIEAKPAIPILGNVLLQVTENRLSVRGTDLDAMASGSAPCEATEAMPALSVPGRIFLMTVTGLPSGSQITLEWSGDREVVLRAGRARYRLNTLPASDFPDFIRPAEPVTFSMPAREFCAGVATTEFAIARDISRIYLRGVSLQICDPKGHGGLGGHAGKHLIFVATNSRELGYRAMPIPEGASAMPNVIIPERSVSEMARIAGGFDGDIELSVAPTLATLRCGSNTLSTKLVDATFPDFMRVIPIDGYRDMIADVSEIDAALSRLINIGDPTKTVLSAEGGNLTFELHDGEGDAKESISVDWSHEPIKKRVNARSLLTVIKHLKTDTCVIRFSPPGKPILFNEYAASKMETSRTFLSMPMEGS